MTSHAKLVPAIVAAERVLAASPRPDGPAV
jgi:hypothetical protein